MCNIHITKIHVLENKVLPIQDGNAKSLQRKTKKTCGTLPWILNKIVKLGTRCEENLQQLHVARFYSSNEGNSVLMKHFLASSIVLLGKCGS